MPWETNQNGVRKGGFCYLEKLAESEGEYRTMAHILT